MLSLRFQSGRRERVQLHSSAAQEKNYRCSQLESQKNWSTSSVRTSTSLNSGDDACNRLMKRKRNSEPVRVCGATRGLVTQRTSRCGATLQKQNGQRQREEELQGSRSENSGIQHMHESNKKFRLEKQQRAMRQTSTVDIHASRSDTSSNRHCSEKLGGKKALHPEGDSFSSSESISAKISGSIHSQERVECSPKSESIPENQREKERLQLLQKFAARGISARDSGKLLQRLHGGRFRSLNEFLYTRKGEEALAKYQKDPKLFELYHSGYRSQVKRWPLNPLDCIATWLEKQPTHWIVGDFGCGEAALALRFPDRKFHSFDLVAANERITACDISSVPLASSSLDVAIFCLSLMGRDWPAFLREAHRTLRPKGHLVIAEVSSRVESLTDFVAAVEGLGFKNNKKEDLASFFFLLQFSKEPRSQKRHAPELAWKLLRPCLYKRR